MFHHFNYTKLCKYIVDSSFVVYTPQQIIQKNDQKSTISRPVLILKHDVETNIKKALSIAKIEAKYNLASCYYFQGNLLESKKNVEIVKKIQSLGHEIGYHHDVMDSANGDHTIAQSHFDKYCDLFFRNGFEVRTVCQHGNPTKKRDGWSSNRDFFRRKLNFPKYKNLTDIMVDFKVKYLSDYEYISDYGYSWHLVNDPINSDIVKSSSDLDLGDFENLINKLNQNKNFIISSHTHRYRNYSIVSKIDKLKYKTIKYIYKKAHRFKFVQNLLNKFYHLLRRI